MHEPHRVIKVSSKSCHQSSADGAKSYSLVGWRGWLPGIDLPVTIAINASNGRRVRWRAPGCGEYWLCACAQLVFEETPPRAWGRQCQSTGPRCCGRNTPTGVGKTRAFLRPEESWQKHPHGRGEDGSAHRCASRGGETPPRAWGRRYRCRQADDLDGNTPTGVGKTAAKRSSCWYRRKHPHGRGEDPW